MSEAPPTASALSKPWAQAVVDSMIKSDSIDNATNIHYDVDEFDSSKVTHEVSDHDIQTSRPNAQPSTPPKTKAKTLRELGDVGNWDEMTEDDIDFSTGFVEFADGTAIKIGSDKSPEAQRQSHKESSLSSSPKKDQGQSQAPPTSKDDEAPSSQADRAPPQHHNRPEGRDERRHYNHDSPRRNYRDNSVGRNRYHSRDNRSGYDRGDPSDYQGQRRYPRGESTSTDRDFNARHHDNRGERLPWNRSRQAGHYEGDSHVNSTH